MNSTLPIVLVPGLLESPRYFAAQLPALWQLGPVAVAVHTRDDSVAGIAQRLLAEAPPKFVLIAHSMGGYVAFEVMREAPQRVIALALTNTTARADTPEQTERRRKLIEVAQAGRFRSVAGMLFPNLVAPSRSNDSQLIEIVRLMAEDTGVEGFIKQETAIIGRIDSRPTLDAIRCPTLVIAGDDDAIIPPERAREIADGIAGARFVSLPRCGHLSALEAPEAMTDALTRWLSQVTSETSGS